MASERRFWPERIAEAARSVLGLCEVYVFGSVAEGRAAGAVSYLRIVGVEENSGRKLRKRLVSPCIIHLKYIWLMNLKPPGTYVTLKR